MFHLDVPRSLHRPQAGLVAAVAAFALAAASAGCSAGDSPEGPSTSAAPATSSPAPDSGGVTLAADPVPVPPGGFATVRVSWEGQEPRTLMFVGICRRPTNSPGFEPGIDCSPLSELNPNGTPDGTGSIDLEVFRGRTPDGDSDWGCFAPGDEPPSGVQALTTCYVRVTNDVVTNAEDARDVAFTITDP